MGIICLILFIPIHIPVKYTLAFSDYFVHTEMSSGRDRVYICAILELFPPDLYIKYFHISISWAMSIESQIISTWPLYKIFIYFYLLGHVYRIPNYFHLTSTLNTWSSVEYSSISISWPMSIESQIISTWPLH